MNNRIVAKKLIRIAKSLVSSAKLPDYILIKGKNCLVKKWIGNFSPGKTAYYDKEENVVYDEQNFNKNLKEWLPMDMDIEELKEQVLDKRLGSCVRIKTPDFIEDLALD